MKKQLFEGKFEIQGEISKGQTGSIFYGYDMGLRQEVAIKIYHSHINGRVIRGRAFIEKSKPLLLIDHPNLIKIFKVEEEDDTPVVFMEFFDAPSLQDLIHDKGPLPVQDMLKLAREITEVLVHTHFQGIIHGTLHPGHVLVGPQGQIKVMDLGLSWILMDILSNCDEELLRPLPYFPPEIAKGELLNLSSDIYCLGFMMYDMLTGTVPYAGLPKTSIMGKLAFDQTDPAFDFPDSTPEPICDLIRDMTRNKAQQRLQDATHVLTIINQQLSKLPLSENSTFSAPVPSQSQASTPKKSAESREATPSSIETPEANTPVIQRPHKAMNYKRVKRIKKLRKLGFFLGIGLLIAGGALGYWYRDLLEPNFYSPQTPIQVPASPMNSPKTMPIENEIPIDPAQEFLNIQDRQSETSNVIENKLPTLSTREESARDSSERPIQVPPESEKKLASPDSIPSPNANKSVSGNTMTSSKKQPVSPVKKPYSEIGTPVSGSTPVTNTKISEKPLQPPPIQNPSTGGQKNKSASSTPTATANTDEPTNKEIEELLESLDAPSTESPLPTAP